MRLNNHTPLFIALLSTIFLAACTTPEKPGEEAGSADAGPATEVLIVDESEEAQAQSQGLGSQGSDSQDLASSQANEEAKSIPRVVYFDFDSSTLGGEGHSIIGAHAAILSQNQHWNIVLEGHADERGTREYNLALGQERAQAVADLLQGYKIPLDRIQLISYGEEEPAVLESNEDAWALNRRVEILY